MNIRRGLALLVFVLAATVACDAAPVATMPGAQAPNPDVAVTLAVAQAMGTQAVAQARATDDAVSTDDAARSAAAAATRQAWWFGVTQTEQAHDVVETETALTGQKLTQSAAVVVALQAGAEATRAAPLTQAAVSATVAAGELRATEEVQRAQRQESWDEFAGLVARAGLLAVVVIALVLAAVGGWRLLGAWALRGLVLETRAGTVFLGYARRNPEAMTLPRQSMVNAAPLPVLESQAPAAAEAPVGNSMVEIEPDPTKALVLRLLHDAVEYEANHPGWPPERIPGWRELQWSSGDTWSKAVKALGEQVTSKSGPNGGTRVVSRWQDVLNLLYAVQAGKVALVGKVELEPA